MNYQKTVLADLEKCYSVNSFSLAGRERYLFASEVTASCLCVDAQTYAVETVWNNKGGTMAIMPLPNSDTDFLAIQNFFPPFDAKESKIVWVHRAKENEFRIYDYISLPYLHRFGIVEREGVLYLVLSTLCKYKKNKDDWTSPGSVYVGVLTNSWQEKPKLREVVTGLFHNHGFFTGVYAGINIVAVGSDQGGFLLVPPQKVNMEWDIQVLTKSPCGEIWLEDLDGDGLPELITIEPFHGENLRVYHLDSEKKYQIIWELPEKMEFGHALWCGELWGEKCGVCGSRRGDAALFRFIFKNGVYDIDIIESKAGSANVWVSEVNGHQYLLSANHMQNACVLYLKSDK